MTSIELSETEESTDRLPPAWIPSLSLAGSAMLHLCLLGLIAAVIAPGVVDGSHQGIVIVADDTILSDAVELEPSFELPGGFSSDDHQSEQSSSAMLDVASAISDSSKVVLEADGEAVAFSQDTALLAGVLTEGLKTNGTGKSGVGSGRGKGTGSGSGDGTGDGAGTGKGKFFGINTKAKSIVFVVDASRSMNMSHPGPAKTRFNRVKQELYTTISAMQESQQFFIIFFGDDAIPMPARALTYADEGNKRIYLEWMMQVQAVGHTFPQNALMLSLNLQPDAIFFLTDGYFDPDIARGVTLTNKKGIPIHTIGFNDNRAETLLLEIAQKNKGTYTYIPGDDDGTDNE